MIATTYFSLSFPLSHIKKSQIMIILLYPIRCLANRNRKEEKAGGVSIIAKENREKVTQVLATRKIQREHPMWGT